MRIIAPSGSPSTSTMRLSPSPHAHRRVLAQEDHVEHRQLEPGFFDYAIVVAFHALQLDPLGAGVDVAVAVPEVLLLEVVDLVSAPLTLEHERQAGVVSDDQGLDRIDQEADAQTRHSENLTRVQR